MKEDSLAPHLRSLRPYEPGKPIADLQRELGLHDVVKLASNENPLGPSPQVLQALRDTDWALHRYPDPAGRDLRAALAKHHRVSADEICLGNGSNELIDLACRVLAGEGAHAVFGEPSFLCYRIGCVAERIAYTAVTLRDAVAWSVPDLLAAMQGNTRLLFVANPNNPTGAYLGREALTQLLEGTPEHVVPVIDEAYVEFASADDYVSALDLRSLHPRLVVLRTFSKAYGLAALRVGYAIGPSTLVASLNRLRAPFNVNALAQQLAVVALADKAHLKRSVDLVKRERALLRGELEARQLEVAPSEANFLLVRLPIPGRSVYEALLPHGVIVRSFGPPIDDAVRITVGTPTENQRLLQALDSVLAASRE